MNRCLTGPTSTNQLFANQPVSPITAATPASATHDCQCHSKTSQPAPAVRTTSEPVKTAVGSLPVLNLPVAHHPSQQRLSAKDTLSEFVEFLQTKQCTMEKGKPCDQCDICNTLGF